MRPAIDSISPFFIVDRVDRSASFNRDQVGFDAYLNVPDPRCTLRRIILRPAADVA